MLTMSSEKKHPFTQIYFFQSKAVLVLNVPAKCKQVKIKDEKEASILI